MIWRSQPATAESSSRFARTAAATSAAAAVSAEEPEDSPVAHLELKMRVHQQLLDMMNLAAIDKMAPRSSGARSARWCANC